MMLSNNQVLVMSSGEAHGGTGQTMRAVAPGQAACYELHGSLRTPGPCPADGVVPNPTGGYNPATRKLLTMFRKDGPRHDLDAQ